MSTKFSRRCLLGLFVTILLSHSVGAEEKPRAAGVNFFERKIRPVLVEHCYKCHSADADKIEAGLTLDTRQGMLNGGESGPAVVPKKPAASLLLSALKYEDSEMPPDKPLPDNVIADFQRWIEIGAPDPRRGKSASAGDDVGPKALGAAELWSLQPVRKTVVPPVSDKSWPRTEIDRFVLAKLESADLAPVGDAPPRALLRRVYFDLIGLPPSPEEISAFDADHSLAAIEQLVDRLLDSPQFGERWARHWLDVARYGESAGSSRDVLMPQAWRYRDYVIDALNADLPYDRFIQEQIAGDLLPSESTAQRDRLRVATGFLAIGSKSLNGGNLTMDIIDEQIDVVGKSVLGLTVSCARCHDHKFDPIPTADYYAMAGVFLSTDTKYGGGIKRPKNDREKLKVLLTLGDDVDAKLESVQENEKKIAALEKQRRVVQKRVQQLQKQLPKDWQQRKKQITDKPADKKLLEKITAYEAAQDELQHMQSQIGQLRKSKVDGLQFAVGVREAAQPRDCKIHIRGDRTKQGESVPRGFLSCVPLDASEVAKSSSGRRELATWLTSSNNPLTVRVAANRIWQHLLGPGLVETVDNFGASGFEPTHPDLLDYLADRFLENGWSTKKLIREIVLSRTYQLSSAYDEGNYSIDPENKLYWRMSRRRLEAEPLRDAMLAAAGKLDLQRPRASAVARIGEGEVGRGINVKPLSEPFPHRSVYLPIIRGMVPELLKTFDFPEPSNPKGRRDITNVPAQSLFLMNSSFVIQQAEALATRLSELATDDAGRIRQAFQLCFTRDATDADIRRCTEFLQRWEKQFSGKQMDPDARRHKALSTLCQALLASSEFRYIE